MADDGRVVFSITGDNRPLRQTLNETTDAIQRESRNWDRAADESSANMSRAFGQAFNVERVKNFAIAAGKALLQLGKEAISAASDLQEVQNVVEATFGGDSGKIDEWARKAGEQFGLTETQAKRFTSTIGAMAKSAGMAGPEIVQMSTDLAGLAADMASFYNLDFDEAFQKIRSGISGQTMPLKELGINMSDATLNAFALQQGLTKTFSQMSQGEQIMLRYQYMMQATADAQGDFARTSDGYANSMRMLETNIDSLKTTIGTAMLGITTDVVNAVNDILGELTKQHDKTILDEFADIDLQTATKIAEIEDTATKARDLVGILEGLNAFTLTDAGAAVYLGDLAGSANELQNSKPRLWKGLIDALDDATFSDELNNETATGITDVATGANSLDITAYSKWDKLKSSLKDFTISDDLKGTTNVGTIAADANSLDLLAPGRWDKLMTALGNTGALSGLASAGESINALSAAINSDGASTDKAAAWQTLLGALAENADALTGLTGESAEDTKAWLETLAAGANTLDPGSAEGWDKLKQTFTEGFTGGNSANVFSGLFGQTDEYAEYLAALGIETGDIADAQALWLDVCKQLVGVIPGLSSVINLETGEVEGGTKALQDYITAWQETEMLQATLTDIQRRRQAVNEHYGDRYSLYAEMIVAQGRANRARDALNALGISDGEGLAATRNMINGDASARDREIAAAIKEAEAAEKALESATKAYNDYDAEWSAAMKALDEQEKAAAERLGETALESEQAAESIYLTGDAATAATNAMTGLGEALQAVNDYYDNTRQSTETMVRSVVQGFGQIESPAEKARREVQDLTAQMADLKDKGQIQIKIADAENTIPTAANMLAGLQDQIAYMDEYQRRLVAARSMGFSEELLASLSDGSLESYDYLGALTGATATQVEQINAAYAEAEAGKEQFTDNLTATKLKADEVFQALVDDANAMITNLDLADGAQNAMESTLTGLVNGIAAKLPDLTTEVDLVLAQIARLDMTGRFNFYGGTLSHTLYSGGFGIGDTGSSETLASNAKGLDYVPFDGYLSVLHEGESILTDAEARVWRNFKYGGASGANSIDYDALG
ncbi:MAG: hypothetical protein II008_20370, partial [Oscillospiraceae bacterium]|nr:hypothetical protein [Oscillospiraceae bacterium]